MAWPSSGAQQQQQQQGWGQGAPQQTMWDTFFRDAHEEMQREFDLVQQPRGQGGQHYGGPAHQQLAQAGAPQPQPGPPPAPCGGKGDWGFKGAKGSTGYDNWTMGKGKGATGRGKGFQGIHDPGNYYYGSGYAQHGHWAHAAQGFGKGAIDAGGGAAAGGHHFVDPYSWAGPGPEWHADGGATQDGWDCADRETDSGCAYAPEEECPACCARAVTVRLECTRHGTDCPCWRTCYECAFRQDADGRYSVGKCPLSREPIVRRTDERASR
eukprot:TRINITY_DN7445_c1_g1_i1.p2 TRINITY_DN7445_c1_g1~~TRINITY_DN7445_c1_g1_i1.p2  ORF type:complete len:268 (+),score=39.59 TRINITY_DN7445_c1_g1_i1:92-895(+)